MYEFISPDNLTPLLIEWSRDLNKTDIDWNGVLSNMYSITNNFKLVQFQYKLLMRISTCKYMRFRMRICRDGGQCSLCHSALETLPHIFLKCKVTIEFVKRLNTFVCMKIDPTYRDPKKFFFITCNHHNNIINYINMSAKWYISKQFQNAKQLTWEGFIRLIRFALTGDKNNIRAALEGTMF